ncbi:MAG TPA: toll/interleukin-1 receptor domain-containing protein, partial [Gaiellaceae bacterium]|nr:toll/interleukin-1 receptor domain-containing protein [Gaiellaceae bacterium]
MTAGGPGAPAAPAAATQRTFRIVISYRRADTGGDARSLAEALERRFGDENVFLDIEAIEPGEPFDQAIDRAVAASDVMLVLIGRHWMTPDEQGRRRIDNPDDVVRMEL